MLLTARTAETYELEGTGMGTDEYMSKPFNPTLLHARAATLLRNAASGTSTTSGIPYSRPMG